MKTKLLFLFVLLSNILFANYDISDSPLNIESYTCTDSQVQSDIADIISNGVVNVTNTEGHETIHYILNFASNSKYSNYNGLMVVYPYGSDTALDSGRTISLDRYSQNFGLSTETTHDGRYYVKVIFTLKSDQKKNCILESSDTTISPTVVTYKPSIVKANTPPTEINVGESVSIIVDATDSDGDLDYISLSWGDGSSPERPSLSGSSDSHTFTKTFNSAGTYTIYATAYDRAKNYSNTLQWSLKVVESQPESACRNFSIDSIQVKPRNSGETSIYLGDDFYIYAYFTNNNNASESSCKVQYYYGGNSNTSFSSSFHTDDLGTFSAGERDNQYSNFKTTTNAGTNYVKVCVADSNRNDLVCDTQSFEVKQTETPNQPPEVSNVTGSVDSNGNLTVYFDPYDPEDETMGADVYLSNPDDTNNFNFASKKTYSPGDFSGTTTRSISYTKSELDSLGITNGKTFKIRVNLFDLQGDQGIGYSNVYTYSYTAPNQNPNKPTIGSHTFTVDLSEGIKIARGSDPDGDSVKLVCWATNSNRTTVNPFESSYTTNTNDVTVSFIFSQTGSQTISCKSVDEHGAESALATKTVSVESVPNDPPQVSNVTGAINSLGGLNVFFDPLDPEGETMGADVYLSYPDNTSDFNPLSRKTYSPPNFSGTSKRSLTYSKSELSNLGIINGKSFKVRVNVFDVHGAEGVGYSSVYTYSYNLPNEAPTLSSDSVTPQTLKSGDSVRFESVWNDPENQYVVDVQVRFKKPDDTSWNTYTMSHVEGYKFQKEFIVNNTAGTYAIQYRAKDSETADGTRINDTGWLSGGSFVIEETPNEAPVHQQTYFSKTNIIESDNFYIYSLWRDNDGDNIEAYFRYKLKNTTNWSEVKMTYTDQINLDDGFTYEFSGGLSRGEYDLQVSAVDLTGNNLPLRTKTWIDIEGGFKVYANGNNPQVTISGFPACVSDAHRGKGYTCVSTNRAFNATFTVSDADGDLKRLEINPDGRAGTEIISKSINGSEDTVTHNFTFTDSHFTSNCTKYYGSEEEYYGKCLKEFFTLTANAYDNREFPYTAPGVTQKFLLYSKEVNDAVNRDKERDKIDDEIDDTKDEIDDKQSEYINYIQSVTSNIDTTLQKNDSRFNNYKDKEHKYLVSHDGTISEAYLNIQYQQVYLKPEINYPATVTLTYFKKDNPYFPYTEPPIEVNNLEHMKLVIDQTIYYMENKEDILAKICSEIDRNPVLEGGICKSLTVDDIITSESIAPLANTIDTKISTSLSAYEKARAARDGARDASKDILNEYVNAPEDLANALLGVMTFSRNLITSPKNTVQKGIDKAKETAEILAMFGDEVEEVMVNLSEIVSGLDEYEKIYFTAYITTHVAHELAPTSKLKLAKLGNTGNIKRAEWLRVARLLQISQKQGYKIKYSYLIHFSNKDFEVIDRILTRKYEGNPLTKSENVILSLLESNKKKEWRPHLLKMWYGNAFNDRRRDDFDYNEVYICKHGISANGLCVDKNGVPATKDKLKDIYVRLDSYNDGTKKSPKGIFSRKDTQMSEYPDEAIKYLDEFVEKYPPGAHIAGDVPSSKKMGISGKLDGQMYLEVPVQNTSIPQNVLKHASDNNIIIRDINGKEYNAI